MSYEMEREKREAIEAGERALASLRAAESDLRSARNWGIWDMFGGRGLSTFIKRMKMTNAKDNMERARYDLMNFRRELGDVHFDGDLRLETDDFLAFADFFFDGFFVDFMMQDRINRAGRQVTEAIRRVENILSRLRYDYR